MGDGNNEQILNVINKYHNEIEQTIINLISEVETKSQQIIRLEEQVSYWKEQYEKLQNQLTQSQKVVIFNSIANIFEQSTEDLKITLSQLNWSTLEITDLFELIDCVLENGMFDIIGNTIKKLISDYDLETELNSILCQRLLRIFEKILLFQTENISSDELYRAHRSILDVLCILKNGQHSALIETLLKNINESSQLKYFSIENFNIFSSLYLQYRLDKELFSWIKNALKLELPLKSDIRDEEIIRLLWYGYYVDLDQLIIDKVPQINGVLSKDYPETSMYELLYQGFETDKPQEQIDKINSLESKIRILSNDEKSILLSKIYKQLYSDENVNDESTKFDKILQIRKKTSNCPRCSSKLITDKIEIRTMHSNSSENREKYYTATVKVCHHCTRAYGTHGEIEELNNKIKPFFIEKKFSEEYKKTKEEKQKKKFNKNKFNWPKTEVNQTEYSKNKDGPDLKPESELHKLGYRITGITREERWKVLTYAVPKLGLEKVANIIAYHVRARKAQKNGNEKFSHAIQEWEYDLYRLRRKYYQGTFNWSSVKK